jgi:hypothetical protein
MEDLVNGIVIVICGTGAVTCLRIVVTLWLGLPPFDPTSIREAQDAYDRRMHTRAVVTALSQK